MSGYDDRPFSSTGEPSPLPLLDRVAFAPLAHHDLDSFIRQRPAAAAAAAAVTPTVPLSPNERFKISHAVPSTIPGLHQNLRSTTRIPTTIIATQGGDSCWAHSASLVTLRLMQSKLPFISLESPPQFPLLTNEYQWIQLVRFILVANERGLSSKEFDNIILYVYLIQLLYIDLMPEARFDISMIVGEQEYRGLHVLATYINNGKIRDVRNIRKAFTPFRDTMLTGTTAEIAEFMPMFTHIIDRVKTLCETFVVDTIRSSIDVIVYTKRYTEVRDIPEIIELINKQLNAKLFLSIAIPLGGRQGSEMRSAHAMVIVAINDSKIIIQNSWGTESKSIFENGYGVSMEVVDGYIHIEIEALLKYWIEISYSTFIHATKRITFGGNRRFNKRTNKRRNKRRNKRTNKRSNK
jgi:hypothetical protein